MKTIRLTLSEAAKNNDNILAQEVSSFLSDTSENDFQPDGANIIEYDINGEQESITWSVWDWKENYMGTYDVQIH